VDRRWCQPKEVSVRAGHTSVSFTLDRYGHLFPGHDDELRDRLDAMHAQGLQAVPGGAVVVLPGGGPARPGAAPARPTAKQANNKTRRKTGPELGQWGCAARDSNPEPLP
jgi:hypothetical protein